MQYRSIHRFMEGPTETSESLALSTIEARRRSRSRFAWARSFSDRVPAALAWPDAIESWFGEDSGVATSSERARRWANCGDAPSDSESRCGRDVSCRNQGRGPMADHLLLEPADELHHLVLGLAAGPSGDVARFESLQIPAAERRRGRLDALVQPRAPIRAAEPTAVERGRRRRDGRWELGPKL